MAPLVLSACIFVISCNAMAQIAGNFYLDKSVFPPGEPVVLHFQVTNNGSRSVNILQADPYTFCSGYEITVSHNSANSTGQPSCPKGFAGDCLSSDTLLRPGASNTEDILLNYEQEVNKPGDYEVEAIRRLPYADARVKFFEAPRENIEVRTKLYFVVDPNLSADPASLQSFVDQLHAESPEQRREAARTLASLAPPALENVLITFADNPEFRQFAPLAFHRLNSPRSMAAMAELLTKTQPGTYEHMTSADYLAQSGDMQWFPLLREVGRNNARISNYVSDAAELGGEKMLPTLLELLKSPDKEFTRMNAISGLGYTHTRDAVPILTELLSIPDRNVVEYAEAALRILTRHSSAANPSQTLMSDYPKWSQWWAREGATAPIYRSDNCADITALP
jgi:HEAT repeat protein